MDIHGLLKTALVENDNARERSLQTELGASSVYGCKRQAWSIIRQVPKTNHDTESLAAIIGTAVHATIAEAMKNIDVFGDDFLIEQGFSTPDLKGHCDLFIKSTGVVIDWKTTTKSKLSKFPTDQQRMQVQLYGYLIEEAGHKVNIVSLVGIPRDGQMKDVKVHHEPYNRDEALKGIQWIKDIQNTIYPPEPERPRQFCKSFCEWYDETGIAGCTGK
jgi:CRISPR/Cas system-associated exonuclease Cas4 (RecB family)